MKILIIGCGAIGSYYGAKLQQGGALVTAAIRTRFDQAQTQGIKIKSPDSEFIFRPKVISEVKQYGEEADYILICTKVLPSITIEELIKPVISNKTTLVLIQNGINIEKDLMQKFPNNEIIRALAFICVSKLSPTFVDHQDYGNLVIGKYPQGNSDKVKNIAQIWQKSNLDCQVSSDIQMESWKKLIWNASFNPISVLANGSTTKQLLDNKYSRQLVVKVMQDIVNIANEDGCNFDEEVINKFKLIIL